MCVVVVTTSACSNGEGTRPAATSPEMCAMSARSLVSFFLRGFYSAVSRERDQGEGTEREREKERERERKRERERERGRSRLV